MLTESQTEEKNRIKNSQTDKTKNTNIVKSKAIETKTINKYEFNKKPEHKTSTNQNENQNIRYDDTETQPKQK